MKKTGTSYYQPSDKRDSVLEIDLRKKNASQLDVKRGDTEDALELNDMAQVSIDNGQEVKIDAISE